MLSRWWPIMTKRSHYKRFSQQYDYLTADLATAQRDLAAARHQPEAAAGRDKQATIEAGQHRATILSLKQELSETSRECEIHRNGADELRKQLKDLKDRHAADVALVNQLTVERDRLAQRLRNIGDMARVPDGVQVVKEHA